MKVFTRCRILLIVIIVGYIVALIMSRCYSNKEDKRLEKYAEVEINHFIVNLIQQIIDQVHEESLDDDKLFNIVRNKYDEIEMIDFNTIEVNNLLEKMTKDIESNINILEKGEYEKLTVHPSFKGKNFTRLKKGVLFELGDDLYNSKLSFLNKDTKVPLRLSFIGNVYTNILTNIKNYGMNSAYMEIKVKVELRTKIFLPTSSKEILIKQDFPLSIKIIQGSIPSYYDQELESNSVSYTLPLKK